MSRLTVTRPSRRFPAGFAADFVRTHGLTTASEEAEWRGRRRRGQTTRDEPTFINHVGVPETGLGSPNSYWAVIESFTVERMIGCADTQTFCGRSMVLAIVREIVELAPGAELHHLHGGLLAVLPSGEKFELFREPMPLRKLVRVAQPLGTPR